MTVMKNNTKVSSADIPHVGKGTPAGEWFRRYWMVVGTTRDLHDIPQAVKVLGEELVLFRDEAGRLGLLGKHCPHRGASLEYGESKTPAYAVRTMAGYSTFTANV